MTNLFIAPRLRLTRGVTLVELLITVVILSILLTIAVPSMQAILRDARLATQSDQLVALLNTARLEAVKRRTNITVCPSPTPNDATACSNSAADWSKGVLVMNGNDILQRMASNGDLSISTDITTITFNATLGSASANSSFGMCVPNSKKHVVQVQASGRISKSINADTCPCTGST